MDYQTFLKTKQIKERPKGFDIPLDELNPMLFDFQKAAVKQALQKGRFLLGEDAGMGKTAQQLEWAHQIHKNTNSDVLIVAPLGVAIQTANEEAPTFGYQVNLCRTAKDIKPGINITNYDMVEHFKDRKWGGVVLDESSILKNFTGATRVLLKDIFKDTPYKLCASATPAPNEFMELLNQGDFLGIMDTSKALANFFINDFKTGTWRLKGHATDAFWEWVCSWALIIDKPSDIGFSDDKYQLPPMTVNEVVIKIDEFNDDLRDGMFRDVELSATGFHKEKRNTAELRARKTAEIISNNPNKQYLVWCDTNYEADLLKQYINGSTEVRGSNTPKHKEEATINFKNGNIKVLISKPSIFGYGMNFQNCSDVIFCGLTYSYEDYYQALKRTYRFGQKNEVNIYIVIGSTEMQILDVVREKERKQVEIKNQMKNSLRDIQILEIQGKEIHRVQNKQTYELPDWL